MICDRTAKLASASGQGTLRDRRPTVAPFIWGNVIEDFLDPLGISLETFCTEFTGSWVFSYARALCAAGVRPVVYCVSRDVRAATRYHHRPSGSVVCALPQTRAYRFIERFMVRPYGRNVRAMFGRMRGWKMPLYPLAALVQSTATYLATPPINAARELKRSRCDAILCQEYEYPRFDVLVGLARFLRVPVFAAFQGGDYHSSPLERYVRPFTVRRGSGLIIGSRSELVRVRTRYGVGRCRIASIPNSVDLATWGSTDRRAAREVLGIPAEARVVAWHGRVDIRRKGLDLLLDAWARITEEAPPGSVRLLMAGTGRDRDELRDRIATQRLQGIVWIDRFVHDRSRLRGYLSAADVYVLPSRHEGFAVAPLEAMACRLPVVAADAPGVSDVFEHGEESGGVVVPREDAVALAREVLRLLMDENRRETMAMRARARVEMRYSDAAVGQALREFLFAETEHACPPAPCTQGMNP